MAKVPNGIETLPKIAIAWVGCTNVTDDRQTDRRQTDERRHYSERERKNYQPLLSNDKIVRLISKLTSCSYNAGITMFSLTVDIVSVGKIDDVALLQEVELMSYCVTAT